MAPASCFIDQVWVGEERMPVGVQLRNEGMGPPSFQPHPPEVACAALFYECSESGPLDRLHSSIFCARRVSVLASHPHVGWLMFERPALECEL